MKIKNFSCLLTILLMLGAPGISKSQTKVVVVPLGGDDFNYNNFSGPQRGLDRGKLQDAGWSVCFEDLYANDMVAATVLAACTKANLLLACGPVVDDFSFTLAAYAPRDDVIFDTGTNDRTTTHRANGSEWYFNSNRSWGFVTAGEQVIKNSADIASSDVDEFRLSWHTVNTSGGFRCGRVRLLNNSSDWRRTVMHRD